MNIKNALITKVSTRKDGSLQIVIETMELSPEQMAELFMNVNKEVMQIDVPDDSSDSKSKSQRLRNVLYVLWEQTGKDKFETFALFYAHQMEKITDFYKDKLEPNER
jgi:hypothetical protein